MTDSKLTIREGGFYRTRDGRRVGPISRGDGNDPTNFWNAPHGCISGARPAWCEDGSFWPKGHEYFCSEMAVHDLVAEWRDEGTLRDLDVKPGDVVEYFCSRGDDVPYGPVTQTWIDLANDWPEADRPHWRLVSRAPATDTDAATIQRVMEASAPSADLTAINTPFGLLPPETQAALKAHDGPVEMLRGVMAPEWFRCPTDDLWVACRTYRAAPQPKVETHTVDGATYFTHDDKTEVLYVRITYTTTNGAIDPASYRVEARP